MRSMFVDATSRVRLGWRLALYVIGFLAIVIVMEVVSGVLAEAGWRAVGDAIGAVLGIGLMNAFTGLVRRRVDRRDPAGMALPPIAERRNDLALGFLAGVGGIAALFGVEWALGYVSLSGTAIDEVGALGATAILLGGLCRMAAVGFVEELAIRGYVFQNLSEGRSIIAGTLGAGLLFGLLHTPNRGFTWQFVASAVIMTVLLVALRLRTGAIWAAIGWHAGWDFMQHSVLGLDLVDQPGSAQTLLHLQQRGPKSLVGVAPSIEGGILVIALEVVSLALLLAVLGARSPLVWRAGLNERGETLQPDVRPAA